MATVARAVHHAHQRGILHRDLKPSNIVIDAEGQPHVTDFGLAKRVEGNSELTRSGAILGTPAYMAPEQASGQQQGDHDGDRRLWPGRSPVRPVGGQTPVPGRLGAGDARTGSAADARAAQRRWAAPVDRDLETVCLKCLEKEPERRYASALALAEDLEALASGRAHSGAADYANGTGLVVVSAQPDARRIDNHHHLIARGFVRGGTRRHVPCLGGQGGPGSRADPATHCRGAGFRIDGEPHTGPSASERAIAQVNQLLYELMSSRWSSIPGIQELRARIARRTIRSLEEYVEELRGDPSGSIELAIIYGQISGIQDSIGAYAESRQAAQKVLLIQESRQARTPDQMGLLTNIATTYWSIGNSFFAEGKLAEAVPSFRYSISVWEHCLRVEPENARVANLLAWLLATCPCTEVREPARAVKLARTAIEHFPNSPAVWNTLGVAQLRAGDARTAVETLKKAMAMKGGGDSFDWFFIAMTYSALGEREDARTWYDRAVDWRLKESPEHMELRLFHDEAAAKLGLPRPVHEEINFRRDVGSGHSKPGRPVP